MDPKTLDVFAWIRQQEKQLKLSTVEIEWMRGIIPGTYEFVSRSTSPALGSWIGLGSSQNRFEAYVRSVAEVIERELMQEFKFATSNGCAVHPLLVEARNRARFELIERDAFFCHFLTSTPFDRLDADPVIFGLPLDELKRILKKRGYAIRMFGMRAAVELPTILAVISPLKKQKFGFFIGTGCGRTTERAAQQAVVEALRSLGLFERGEMRDTAISVSEFKKSAKKCGGLLYDHMRLHLNAAYAKQVETLLFSEPVATKKIGQPFLSFSEIPAKSYSLKRSKFKDLPMHFARADHPDLQQLFFGLSDPHRLNEPRLKRFMGLSPFSRKSVNINPLPHPFG